MANYGKRVSVFIRPRSPIQFSNQHRRISNGWKATYREELIGMKAESGELIKIAKRYITCRIAELNADAQSEVVPSCSR